MDLVNYMHGNINDKGFSLVELIVAITLGLILSGGIAALITTSLSMYKNESTRVDLQYELQTGLNQVMDGIMGSDGFVIKNNANSTQYAGFGNYYWDAEGNAGFAGIVLLNIGDGSIYMNRITDIEFGSSSDANALIASITNDMKDKIENGTVDKRVYLLSEHVNKFLLTPGDNCLDDSTNEYINPLAVKVEMEFQDVKWGGGTIDKKVNDVAYLRNWVSGREKDSDSSVTATPTGFVYYNGNAYQCKSN